MSGAGSGTTAESLLIAFDSSLISNNSIFPEARTRAVASVRNVGMLIPELQLGDEDGGPEAVATAPSLVIQADSLRLPASASPGTATAAKSARKGTTRRARFRTLASGSPRPASSLLISA